MQGQTWERLNSQLSTTIALPALSSAAGIEADIVDEPQGQAISLSYSAGSVSIPLPEGADADSLKLVFDKATSQLTISVTAPASELPAYCKAADESNPLAAHPRVPRPRTVGAVLQRGSWCAGRAKMQFVPASDSDTPIAALLVMLHGLGDGPRNYAALGKRMNLPQTAVRIRPPALTYISVNCKPAKLFVDQQLLTDGMG